MKNFQRLSLPVAVLAGAMTVSSSVAANNIKYTETSVPIVSGHNVIDAVDDVRETTADLVGALKEARASFVFEDWYATEAQLNNMEKDLQAMERTLDQKADASDSSWLNWMADRDYSVTVKTQVEALARHLSALDTMLDGTEGHDEAQIVVSHNVVDQVDDVRETVADLFSALSDAGAKLGWFDDAEQFSTELAELERMEKALDRKAEMTDQEWAHFVTSPDYHTSIHSDIETLTNMLEHAADQLHGAMRVSLTQ